MIDLIGHFAFETVCAAIAIAAITAGLAVLFTPQGWLARRIPVVGDIIEGMRQAVAVVLIGIGCIAAGVLGGYWHRGSLEHDAALRAQIETQKAIKVERDRREAEFAAARKADAENADRLAAELQALRDAQGKADELSRAHDREPGLSVDSVRRLNAIGRAGNRR